MAHINFPTATPSNFTLNLQTPGTVVRRSIGDGTDHVTSRGVAFWDGSVSYGSYDRRVENALASEVAAFAVALGAGDNTFDFAVPEFLNPNQAARWPDTVTSITMSSFLSTGILAEITISQPANQTLGIPGFQTGDVITIDNNLHMVISPQIDQTMFVCPGRITGSAGAEINWKTPYQRARGSDRGAPPIGIRPGGTQPITIRWTQSYG